MKFNDEMSDSFDEQFDEQFNQVMGAAKFTVMITAVVWLLFGVGALAALGAIIYFAGMLLGAF